MNEYHAKIIENLHLVAEELKLCMNLDVTVNEETRTLELDTIAGRLNYNLTFTNYMEDVYRFIMIYGIKLYYWGRESRIKESNKQTKE